jgi:bifunctional enzyme CysN/CysC
VQYVIRPHQDFRGFAGRVASGTIAPGEEVVVLPSAARAGSARSRPPTALRRARPPATPSCSPLEDEIDISRGDMIVRRMNVPIVGHALRRHRLLDGRGAARPGGAYVLMHTTRQVKAFVSASSTASTWTRCTATRSRRSA